MAILAVLMPVLMLVVMLALGRYEELMLPIPAEEPEAATATPHQVAEQAEDREMFEART
ncbi:hypothetical protein [Streptomyces sp. NPDC050560]|uniref:hypothetical protein n=1 Tax=Streptomyces sp. NPDC050560 TaxID=3365630 RepID=UPI0037A1492E